MAVLIWGREEPSPWLTGWSQLLADAVWPVSVVSYPAAQNQYLPLHQQLDASLCSILLLIHRAISQSLDAGWIYTSNLQVKGSGSFPQFLDLSLSPGSCAKRTLESVLPGLLTLIVQEQRGVHV